MIKVYQNGSLFLNDNKEFLDLNKYLAVFFYLDAKVLNETSKKNYAIKVEDGNNKLLAIKVEAFSMVLYGSPLCLDIVLKYLYDNDYEFDGIFAPKEIGDKLCSYSNGFIGKTYYESIGMDFMICKEKTIESSFLVKKATINDIDLIYENYMAFIIDCGLPDKPNKDSITKNLDSFRVIKENNQVVSMAAFSKDLDDSCRITHVYTKPSYRGKGYAKLIVNNIKNEIIDLGKFATLNVDKKNPISYHIYSSLGFKKLFSQGIYLVKKD